MKGGCGKHQEGYSVISEELGRDQVRGVWVGGEVSSKIPSY